MSNKISSDVVKELRDQTCAGIMECRNALLKTNGDMEKAKEILRQKGAEKADKKKDRATNAGRVEAYIHMDKIGSIVELNCETDFVAKNEKFQRLAKDIAMQVAAMSPKYVDRENIPLHLVEKQRDVIKALVLDENKDSKKPAEVLEKIAAGKLEKYFQSVCLVEQNFIKEPGKTVADIIKDTVGTLGENISVRRFVRVALGEE